MSNTNTRIVAMNTFMANALLLIRNKTDFEWNIGLVMTPQNFAPMRLLRIFLTVAGVVVIIYVLIISQYLAKILLLLIEGTNV
ncbi:MAG: hypothetical protein WCL51_03180 [Bacteroidota bacterium]